MTSLPGPLALLALLATPLPAQTTATSPWPLSSNGSDDARLVLADASGRSFAAGVWNENPIDGGSAFVASWDTAGALLWTTTFDSATAYQERPSALLPDGSGGIYLAGWTGDGSPRNFILRIDAAGSLLWAVEQGASGAALGPAALLVAPSGRAILGGSVVANGGDFAITAFAPIGGVDWLTTIDGGSSSADRVVDMAFAPDGSVVAVGRSYLSPGWLRPFVMRVAPDGAMVQAFPVALPNVLGNTPVAVAVDASNRVYIASLLETSQSAPPSLLVTALDGTAIVWTREIQGPAQMFGGGAGPTDLALDPYGRLVVLGWRAHGLQGSGFVLAAYERDGTQAFEHVATEIDPATPWELWLQPFALALTSTGEWVVTGQLSRAFGYTRTDAFVYGVDMLGERRFASTLGFTPTSGGWSDRAVGIAPTADGFVISGRVQVGPSSTGFDAFVARYTRTASGFCFGDGASANCPCGNTSAPVQLAGCTGSSGIGGRLVDTGSSSLASDSFTLIGSGMPDSSAVYLQASDATAPSPFGDGARCIGGSILRLGTKTNQGGTSRYPEPLDAPISVRGQIGSPGTRVYQVWYRDAAPFCTSAPFNVTHAVRVSWTP